MFQAIPGVRDYAVDHKGNVWSLKYGRVKKLKLIKGSRGYLQVNISTEGTVSTWRVHVLVCLAFHGAKPPEMDCVRHLDGDKSNNTPENLAWGTNADNAKDAVRHGTQASGEKIGASKLLASDVERIRWLAELGETVTAIANRYGVEPSTVSRIIRGKSWKRRRKRSERTIHPEP